MISHKHKCIFIHVSKCAGSSIETNFGIKINDNTENNNKNLFGWNSKSKLFLQHATPEELFKHHFITREIWDTYYKFIIVRNPFDRALSDYIWLMKEISKKDSFVNFLNRKGEFEIVLTNNDTMEYRGDHLKKQIDYFYLGDKLINYNRVLRFENLEEELNLVANDLSLKPGFFNQKVNIGEKKIWHYSKFYNKKRKNDVEELYKDDIKFFDYSFEDKRNLFDYLNFIKKPSYDLI